MAGKLQFYADIKCGSGQGPSESISTQIINSTPTTDVGKSIGGLDLGPLDALNLGSIVQTSALELAIIISDKQIILCFGATTGAANNSSFVLDPGVPFILSSNGTLNYNSNFGSRLYNPTDRTLNEITLYNPSTTDTASVEIFAV